MTFKAATCTELTNDPGNDHVKTQSAQGKRSILPAGITLLTDPEHLNHQKDPFEEYHNGDEDQKPFLKGPRSDP